ncbi:hypothetical protein GCM10010174_50280 [Kutzneria viridogrisea]|uniref:OmpR/PhoB-type domain-containing protein n=2 Tax=Kutzneria TaxID=43356 RepID=W5WDL5_9PSEU|nr:AfsR/SARP family transcriptional regulator [Kutzneria albida]AHH99268.1 hypothetical protein KALB_5907 [Kutzneria albida DSM 43870]MBA8923178.1 DNA-binding SARP family transcriptional activator [Kutzneria viridogrisea]
MIRRIAGRAGDARRRGTLRPADGLDYRVLGPVGVSDGLRELPVDGSKPRTVLAALLLSGQRLVSDSQLSDLLWGQDPPATSHAQICTYVSRLRKALGRGAVIERRSPGYVLHIGQGNLDLARFESDAELGRSALALGRYEQASRKLRSALDRWHGPALAGVSERLVSSAAPGLEEARISVLERRIEADLALGGHAELLPELAGLVAEHPLRDRLRAQLMTALYRSDRQADALALFDEGRRTLADEFGVHPGELLRRVHHAILTGAPELDWPPGRSVVRTANSV